MQLIIQNAWVQETGLNANAPSSSTATAIRESVTPPYENRPTGNSVIKVIKHDDMGEFLVWPETPKRKGKRTTERYPFAITSEKYKLMFQNNLTEKRKAEEEKEERKRKREEKKRKLETKKLFEHH